MKMKEFGPPGGARVPGAPLRSANGLVVNDEINDENIYLFTGTILCMTYQTNHAGSFHGW